MIVPQAFVTHFARTVDLFRNPQAKEAQKAEFRALLALLKIEQVTLKPDGEHVVVNGTAVSGPAYTGLRQRLDLHGVDEIVIPPDPPPAELFELLKALAEQPGDVDVPTRLRQAGAQRITVVRAPLILPTSDVSEPMTPFDGPASPGSAEPASVAAAAGEGAGEGQAEGEAREGEEGAEEEGLLARLQADPGAPRVGDVIAALAQLIEAALDRGRVERALRIVATIARSEEKARSAAVRRQYAIALKRLYSKRMLEAFAQLVQVPAHEADAVIAIQRAGAPGVEVLLDLLVASPTIGERQGIFNALTKMKEGTDQLVHMLGHPQWFVVRNIAELVGELGLEEAVPALARQLGHADLRVRKAAALALAKIGNRGAADALRRALRDKSPEVRMQAALGVGGRKAGALAMPLVVAMEQEKDEVVERELVLALGRIASADAVQALIKAVQPSGKLFGRKPTELRVAAVEALRLAGTPAAVGTLQGLTGDSDKQVRAAAEAALQDLRVARAGDR